MILNTFINCRLIEYFEPKEETESSVAILHVVFRNLQSNP